MSNNRSSVSRPKDAAATSLSDLFISADESLAKPFHLAQVIDSNDPKNANRIKVRIPLLDDPFYYNDKGKLTEEGGHDKLPWCLPANSRFIDTPENGSVVLIALFNPQNPSQGRVWFSALTELNAKEIFDTDKLQEELNQKPWQNAEDSIKVSFGNTPSLRGKKPLKSKIKKINQKTGIRGKDKNKLLFEKGKTTLIQNENTANESKLELTKNVLLMAKELELVSSNSARREKPVFADPLFIFLEAQLQFFSSIVTCLSTVPGISPFLGLPVSPSPAGTALVTMYAQLASQYATFKATGSSKFLKIN